MFTSLFVVILIEFADKFFEDRAHCVVVDTCGSEVDFRVEKLVDKCTEGVSFRECGELVAELEVFENVLNVG